MRDNPYKNTGMQPEEVQYAGDNFVRYSGDTRKHATAQLFAWEAYEKGVDVHLLAEPTKLELLNQEFEKRKVQFKDTVRGSILDKYGGAEHLDMPDKELLLAQSEQYTEYSRHGKVIKGLEKAVVRSRYEEDVYTNNHTSVWGSYWRNGFWGYKCCHQFVKNSYCIGESGKKAVEGQQEICIQSDNKINADGDNDDGTKEEAIKLLLEEHQERLSKKQKKREKKKRQEKLKKNKKKDKIVPSSSSENEDEEAAKQQRLKIVRKMALFMEDENKSNADRLLSMDERKRPYNSMYQIKEPSQEEMEAYYMKKCRSDDPMADFLGQ
uniref:Pre-mRNA-splicing factor SLU7 n=1 Tax=Strigamia maritima TaxID=126957 RepID=T1J8Q9_STRMM